jgi:hypothetical protein
MKYVFFNNSDERVANNSKGIKAIVRGTTGQVKVPS